MSNMKYLKFLNNLECFKINWQLGTVEYLQSIDDLGKYYNTSLGKPIINADQLLIRSTNGRWQGNYVVDSNIGRGSSGFVYRFKLNENVPNELEITASDSESETKKKNKLKLKWDSYLKKLPKQIAVKLIEKYAQKEVDIIQAVNAADCHFADLEQKYGMRTSSCARIPAHVLMFNDGTDSDLNPPQQQAIVVMKLANPADTLRSKDFDDRTALHVMRSIVAEMKFAYTTYTLLSFDMKLDNLLYTCDNSEATLSITDYGGLAYEGADEENRALVGTYCPPWFLRDSLEEPLKKENYATITVANSLFTVAPMMLSLLNVHIKSPPVPENWLFPRLLTNQRIALADTLPEASSENRADQYLMYRSGTVYKAKWMFESLLRGDYVIRNDKDIVREDRRLSNVVIDLICYCACYKRERVGRGHFDASKASTKLTFEKVLEKIDNAILTFEPRERRGSTR